LAAAIAPFAKNPNLVWLYTALSIATLLTGLLFWACFRKYNAIEETTQFDNGDERSIQLEELSETPTSSSTEHLG
jgi:POT family proton-dependent oligopeptide transporter